MRQPLDRFQRFVRPDRQLRRAPAAHDPLQIVAQRAAELLLQACRAACRGDRRRPAKSAARVNSLGIARTAGLIGQPQDELLWPAPGRWNRWPAVRHRIAVVDQHDVVGFGAADQGRPLIARLGQHQHDGRDGRDPQQQQQQLLEHDPGAVRFWLASRNSIAAQPTRRCRSRLIRWINIGTPNSAKPHSSGACTTENMRLKSSLSVCQAGAHAHRGAAAGRGSRWIRFAPGRPGDCSSRRPGRRPAAGWCAAGRNRPRCRVQPRRTSSR